MPEKKNGRIIVKVWGLFHDRVGYQVYTQAAANPNFWYDPEGKRWRLENIGELLGKYAMEDVALSAKGLAEDIEIEHRDKMLFALKQYNEEKVKLEDFIRSNINAFGGKVE